MTFLFTDIEGSSGLAQRHPDEFVALLGRHNAILRESVEAHDGYVFQIFIGDAFCVAFHTAGDGVHGPGCAAPLSRNRRRRSGCGWGSTRGRLVPETEGDRSGGYTGYSTMARVQRVMSAGHGGQVLLSDSTASQSGQCPNGVTLRDLGRAPA